MTSCQPWNSARCWARARGTRYFTNSQSWSGLGSWGRGGRGGKGSPQQAHSGPVQLTCFADCSLGLRGAATGRTCRACSEPPRSLGADRARRLASESGRWVGACVPAAVVRVSGRFVGLEQCLALEEPLSEANGLRGRPTPCELEHAACLSWTRGRAKEQSKVQWIPLCQGAVPVT